jgi:ABC-2 type transport system ATP-binding protein
VLVAYVSIWAAGGAAAMTTTSPDRAGADSGASDETVIDVSGLRMRYGAFEAVRGIDLHVMRGEVFAFLGPNGAGGSRSFTSP